MARTLRDLLKLGMPLKQEHRDLLAHAATVLSKDDLAQLKEYLKTDRCFAVPQQFGTILFPDTEWPLLKSHRKEHAVDAFLTDVNERLMLAAKQRAFHAFAHDALERIPHGIAPHIVGHDAAKRAIALQLFATEPVHVLLIGDPGTGKTDLLRSAHALAPIASFGLGSGVSGVGLSAVAKGDQLLKGLLPLADNGIACIDELNLIKAKDLAALYNAMEKGFITYDKGTKHEQLNARVRVCATANPSTHTFVGQTADVLRKQIPFDDALLSRFHLIFIVRKPSEEAFAAIAHNVVTGKKTELAPGDTRFIQEYVAHAAALHVYVPGELEQRIVGYVRELKTEERKFLQEVSPRTAAGIVRLVRAAARAELKETVEEQHLAYVFALVTAALHRERA